MWVAHRALPAATGSTPKHAHHLLAFSLPRTKQAVGILKYPQSTCEIVIHGMTGHPLPPMDQHSAARPALDLLLSPREGKRRDAGIYLSASNREF